MEGKTEEGNASSSLFCIFIVDILSSVFFFVTLLKIVAYGFNIIFYRSWQ